MSSGELADIHLLLREEQYFRPFRAFVDATEGVRQSGSRPIRG